MMISLVGKCGEGRCGHWEGDCQDLSAGSQLSTGIDDGLRYGRGWEGMSSYRWVQWVQSVECSACSPAWPSLSQPAPRSSPRRGDLKTVSPAVTDTP